MVKRIAKRWLAALLCALGFHHVARWFHRRQLLILAYHVVSESAGISSSSSSVTSPAITEC